MPLWRRQSDRLRAVRDEPGAWHFGRAHRRQVPGVLLAVDAGDAIGAAKGHQCRKRDLGRIAAPAEHRLAIHCAAKRHAIQAADQLTIDPGLDTVGLSFPVQSKVGLLHLWHDPGAGVRSTTRRRSTMLDHLRKCRIEPDLAVG